MWSCGSLGTFGFFFHGNIQASMSTPIKIWTGFLPHLFYFFSFFVIFFIFWVFPLKNRELKESHHAIITRDEHRPLSPLITTSFPSITTKTHNHRCSFFTSLVPMTSNSKTISIFTTPNSNPLTPICRWSTSILTIVITAKGKEKSGGAKVIVTATRSITTSTIVAKPNFLQCTSTYFFRSITNTQKDNLGTKKWSQLRVHESNITFHVKIWFSYFIISWIPKIIYFLNDSIKTQVSWKDYTWNEWKSVVIVKTVKKMFYFLRYSVKLVIKDVSCMTHQSNFCKIKIIFSMCTKQQIGYCSKKGNLALFYKLLFHLWSPCCTILSFDRPGKTHTKVNHNNEASLPIGTKAATFSFLSSISLFLYGHQRHLWAHQSQLPTL